MTFGASRLSPPTKSFEDVTGKVTRVRGGGSRNQRSAGDACGAKHAAVAFNLIRRPQRLRVIVGELDCRLAFGVGDLANQTDGIKAAAAVRITAPEIVGEQSAPAGAEADPAARLPLLLIQKIGGSTEIFGCHARLKRPAKIGVQAQYFVNVQAI